MKTAYSIQSLRALAALAVLLFHAAVFPAGYGGVDIFFVISGYIMGMAGVKDGPGEFLVKRIVRIAPLYWIVTLMMCALAVFTHVFSKFVFDPEMLFKSLFFIPYFDANGKIWPLLVPGWTLNYEMFFYIVFAVGLLLRRPVPIVVATMLVLVTSGFFIEGKTAPLHIYTSPMLLEFAAGLLLWYFQSFKGRLIGSILVAFALGGFVHFTLVGTEGEYRRLLDIGLPAFLLVAGCIALERAGAWPRLRFLETIGDASYSLYLLHGNIILVLAKVGIDRLGIARIPVEIAACLMVAWLSYRYFELPVGRLLRKTLLERSASLKVTADGTA